ncbi:protein kinase [Kovacikia minuta CCNUW1]|uniref:serine/threonine protein kinase n=1 Tax=Kovacikia minuta TaxID=2931930 RepID=UPI001CCAB2B6|nr:serine/threonine-protein kinase [Kovacikia minuta]UBF28975.1 protein kinase [Kovacikia minuta CCNUW1]
MLAPLASGTLLDNRYRVVGVARRGKYGQTYLARDQKQFNELCVLKEFVPSQQDPAIAATLLQLFHQEASTLYGLRHPQLPRPRAMIVEGQRFYWVREYVEGKSYGVLLNDRKAKGQTFSEDEVMRLILQLLPVLSYIHSRGVIHGNISPDSLILRQQDQLPVLINYGLVRDLVARLQLHPVTPEDARGRWGYTPPEKQSAGRVYPNSDLYSLAVTAIVLLTAKPPEELYNESSQSFEWGQGGMVNPKFARILRQMLDQRPQKRFASAEQVLQALEPAMGASIQTSDTQPFPASISVQPAPPPAPKYSPNSGSNQPAPPAALPYPSTSDSEPSLPPRPEPLTPEPPTPEVSADSEMVQPVQATVLQPAEEEHQPAAGEPAAIRKRVRRNRSSGDPRASVAMAVGLALLVGVISWRALSSMRSQPKPPESPPAETANPAPQSPVAQKPVEKEPPAKNPAPKKSPPKPGQAPAPLAARSVPAKKPSGEKPTKQENLTATSASSLRDRLRKLEVNNQVFTELTNEVFYAKYPQFKDQQGGGKTEQGKARWNETANNVIDKLESLSPESRKKIGTYQRSDYDQWLTALGEADAKNSPTLDALADGRFFKWFPNQKGKPINPRTTGQVWYAIAADQLDAAKAKKAAQPRKNPAPKADKVD